MTTRNQTINGAHVGWPGRVRGFFANLAWYQTGIGLILLLLVLAFLSVEAGAVVDQSRAALPGDRLYPVKHLAEQVTLLSLVNDNDRAKLHANFIRTRLYEIV